MTKPEIYQALAEGKTVQARPRSGADWRVPSETLLLGWLISDICDGAFDEANYRLAPVPPGDLTYEEACIAQAKGEPIQWMVLPPVSEPPEWRNADTLVDYPSVRSRYAYRRKLAPPAPKMVPLVGCLLWPLGEAWPKTADRVESNDGGTTWQRWKEEK